jgi:hypothetical protein
MSKLEIMVKSILATLCIMSMFFIGIFVLYTGNRVFFIINNCLIGLIIYLLSWEVLEKQSSLKAGTGVGEK